ncbi:hypothetical protein IWQ60_003914 [Tieghemiomyces parasiticus]|uniref:G-protein coupled receptors family 2 profile 2 domain-containing protein n=1 Tax=Tieghemiomyces parasiticus TaxID=78921 RepID=A0A9W8DW02_9FUNG|nr:hypothetical protein IWQ60_003914 [Tieghemiomyces parasiticus]
MLQTSLGELTRAQANILGTTARVTNSLSITVCISMVIIFLFIYRFDRVLANRVIFRLTFYMCIIDSGYAGAQIVQNNFTAPSPVCTASAWALVFFNLLSAFFRVLVAVHLQLVFIHQHTNARRYERHYIILAFLAAAGCSVAPAVGSMYGWVSSQWFCWFKNDGNIHSLLWQWFSYYLWLSLAVLYCLVVVILVFRRISRIESEVNSAMHLPVASVVHPVLTPSQVALHNYRIAAVSPRFPVSTPDLPATKSDTSLGEAGQRPAFDVWSDHPSSSLCHSGRYSEGHIAEKYQPLARKCLRRVIWYPIIPIVTQSMVIVNAFTNYFSNSVNMPIYVTATALAGLQGVFTGIVFVFDPSVRRAYDQLVSYLLERYYYQYYLLRADPGLSPRTEAEEEIPHPTLGSMDSAVTVRDDHLENALSCLSNPQSPALVTAQLLTTPGAILDGAQVVGGRRGSVPYLLAYDLAPAPGSDQPAPATALGSVSSAVPTALHHVIGETCPSPSGVACPCSNQPGADGSRNDSGATLTGHASWPIPLYRADSGLLDYPLLGPRTPGTHSLPPPSASDSSLVPLEGPTACPHGTLVAPLIPERTDTSLIDDGADWPESSPSPRGSKTAGIYERRGTLTSLFSADPYCQPHLNHPATFGSGLTHRASRGCFVSFPPSRPFKHPRWAALIHRIVRIVWVRACHRSQLVTRMQRQRRTSCAC